MWDNKGITIYHRPGPASFPGLPWSPTRAGFRWPIPSTVCWPNITRVVDVDGGYILASGRHHRLNLLISIYSSSPKVEMGKNMSNPTYIYILKWAMNMYCQIYLTSISCMFLFGIAFKQKSRMRHGSTRPFFPPAWGIIARDKWLTILMIVSPLSRISHS